MKREEVKQKIPGISEEQLQWLMDESNADVTREVKRANELQADLDNANKQLQTAQDGLKAFEGVDVKDLQGQIAKLRSDMAAQADAFAFDSALAGAIRDARGRDVKAIRGMLDIDALKTSKDRTADIRAALDTLVKEKAWAFESGSGSSAGTGVTVATGGEHGTGGSTGDDDGVAAAFASLNPDLKL